MSTGTARFPRSSPYWPVLSHPRLRRVLPGLVVSALGDGMSVVAISWLALQLAPAGEGGTWVAIAFAAYLLPGAAGSVLFARFLHGRGGAQLAGWNATLRAVALGAVAAGHAAGLLDLAGYVTLLALAGFLIAWTDPAVVIGIDALTFAVLALTYRLAVPATRRSRDEAAGSRTAGFTAIFRDRTLFGLLVLSFGFFFLIGPVYAALPVHVAIDLRAPATVLGLFFTAFGIGAVAGGLVAGYLRRRPLWPTIVCIVAGGGTAMLPLGLGAPTGVALAGFVLAGIIWAPFNALSMALFQRGTPPDRLAAVLAAYGAILVPAVPLGTMLGGPLVGAIGARGTLLACSLATVALGAGAATLLAVRSARRG
jgi:DHA3 family macrolide efflux protein-like MFS transporter